MRRFADTVAWGDDRGGFAIDVAVDARMGFIRRTYLHLIAEIGGVAAVANLVMNVDVLRGIAIALMSSIFLYIAVFFGVSLISRKLMAGHKSLAMQYTGAGLWVFFLGMLVAPLAMYAHAATGSYGVLLEALIMTGCVFGGLTGYVFFSRKDFSFMGGALAIMSWILFGAAVLWTLFGASYNIVISILFVALLGGWVLYDTSRIIHHRRVDEYVSASVDLLVDFVYMFIHIVMILLSGRD